MALANVTKEQQDAYFAKMLPYGAKVERRLGIDKEIAVAWWSWETHWGTNESSRKGNNHGGIKFTSNADFKVGMYAGYNSISRFVDDFVRVLTIPGYGYPGVLASANINGPDDVAGITRAMNASKYAQDDYNISTIRERVERIRNMTYRPAASPEVNDSNREQYAAIGAALVAAVAAALAFSAE